MGRLTGAIAERAEGLIATLSPGTRGHLDAVLRALVTISRGDVAPTAATVNRSRIATSPERTEILDKLIDARLVVTDDMENRGDPKCRLAHEKLIETWPRLKKLAVSDRAFLETRARLQAAAEGWKARGAKRDLSIAERQPAGGRRGDAEGAPRRARQADDRFRREVGRRRQRRPDAEVAANPHGGRGAGRPVAMLDGARRASPGSRSSRSRPRPRRRASPPTSPIAVSASPSMRLRRSTRRSAPAAPTSRACSPKPTPCSIPRASTAVAPRVMLPTTSTSGGPACSCRSPRPASASATTRSQRDRFFDARALVEPMCGLDVVATHRLPPRAGQSYQVEGSYLINTGKPDDALKAFDLALQSRPAEPTPDAQAGSVAFDRARTHEGRRNRPRLPPGRHDDAITAVNACSAAVAEARAAKAAEAAIRVHGGPLHPTRGPGRCARHKDKRSDEAMNEGGRGQGQLWARRSRATVRTSPRSSGRAARRPLRWAASTSTRSRNQPARPLTRGGASACSSLPSRPIAEQSARESSCNGLLITRRRPMCGSAARTWRSRRPQSARRPGGQPPRHATGCLLARYPTPVARVPRRPLRRP